jgi:hypothetical protein
VSALLCLLPLPPAAVFYGKLTKLLPLPKLAMT